MNQKVGVCKQCGFPRPVNSKCICPDCVFKNNHQGLNQQAVYLERHRIREEQQPKKYMIKHTRKKVSVRSLLKSERFEKRREQIRKDEETYEQVFFNNPPFCEECHRKLNNIFRDEDGQVIARFQYSHILTKAAHPEFRNDPRNFNRLCFRCHQTWEFGDRVEMRIYPKNQETVQILRDEKNKRREE